MVAVGLLSLLKMPELRQFERESAKGPHLWFSVSWFFLQHQMLTFQDVLGYVRSDFPYLCTYLGNRPCFLWALTAIAPMFPFCDLQQYVLVAQWWSTPLVQAKDVFFRGNPAKYSEKHSFVFALATSFGQFQGKHSNGRRPVKCSLDYWRCHGPFTDRGEVVLQVFLKDRQTDYTFVI